MASSRVGEDARSEEYSGSRLMTMLSPFHQKFGKTLYDPFRGAILHLMFVFLPPQNGLGFGQSPICASPQQPLSSRFMPTEAKKRNQGGIALSLRDRNPWRHRSSIPTSQIPLA